MTRLIFSALAVVAFAGSAFASNEVKNNKEMFLSCMLTITIVEDGRVVDMIYLTGPSTPDRKKCYDWALGEIEKVEKKGLEISTWEIARS